MLAEFGSIASILGLSIQGYGKITKQYKGAGGEALVALKVLSQSTAAWKKIHQSYHSLNKELSTILPIISVYDGGFGQKKDADEISGNELKNKFTNGLLSISVSGFQSDTEPYIKTLEHQLKHANNLRDSEIEKFRNKGKMSLAESLEKIVKAHKIVLTTHGKFTTFLDQIKNFKEQEKWLSPQKEYILESYFLIKEDVPEIIYETDKALMSLLGFYEEILKEIN